MTPLRFASARRGLLAQRTFTSKSRVMLGAHIGRGGVTTAPPRHHIRHPTTTLCNGACAPFVLGWALKEPQPPAMIGTCLNLL
jgi:hypothetical protein